jgi:uncharacterized membrane protein
VRQTAAPRGGSRARRQARPPWALSPAESRLLVITFAGGLASIVAAACVIGGAIAFDRTQRHNLGNWAVVTAAVLLIAVATPFVTSRNLKRARPGLPGLIVRFYVWVAVLSAIILVGFVLLLWVGIAAGVK